jgi:short-subunit dehydrogenase
MIRRGAGGIINVASLLALSGTLAPDPLPYRATYAAAKSFMVTFTQALAGEIKGSGVRLSVCLPGRVATEFHTSQGIDISKFPPMMTADDIACGALAGLAQGEITCVPALADVGLLARLSEAQVELFTAALVQPQPTLAERYREPARRNQ